MIDKVFTSFLAIYAILRFSTFWSCSWKTIFEVGKPLQQLNENGRFFGRRRSETAERASGRRTDESLGERGRNFAPILPQTVEVP